MGILAIIALMACAALCIALCAATRIQMRINLLVKARLDRLEDQSR